MIIEHFCKYQEKKITYKEIKNIKMNSSAYYAKQMTIIID